MKGERDRIRDAIAGIDTNMIGQEGRGAAQDVRQRALARCEEEWARTDAVETRRAQVHAALVEAIYADPIRGAEWGKGVPELLARQLLAFVVALDDRTWQPGKLVEPIDPRHDP